MSRYDFELDMDLRNSLSVIARRIKKGAHVLEFGPANGRLTKYLKEELGCHVCCVEIDEEAAKQTSLYCDKIVVGDIEEYGWVNEFEGMEFEFILFADVLEHLRNPKNVLLRCKDFLKEDGSIVISLPNIAHNSIIMELLKNRFGYRKTGILDDTHIKFFTYSSFALLLEEIGLFKSFEAGLFLGAQETEFDSEYDEFPEAVVEFLKNRGDAEIYQYVYELSAKGQKEIERDFEERAKIVTNFVQLYVDTGDGINEEKSKQIDFVEQKKFVFLLDEYAEKEIEEIRFDPLNDAIVLRLNSFLIDGEDFSSAVMSNGFVSDEGLFYFGNKDPQMWIKLPEKMSVRLIEAEFETVFNGSKAIKKVAEICNEAVKRRDKQIDELKKISENLSKELVEQIAKTIYFENLAQSLRLKNRLKRVVKKIVPSGVWSFLKYLKNNSAFSKISTVLNYRPFIYSAPILTEAIIDEMNNFKIKPLMSIVMPVFNVAPKWLDAAIKSVESQWYENWELCIADDKSTNKKTLNYLKSIKNPKIKVKFLEKNLGIAGASNEAAGFADGEYIVLMDNDDEITIDALYEIVKAVNENGAEFIYSDEDKIERGGSFSEPHFKADFAIDMFLSQNYISHIGAIKKSVFDLIGGWRDGFNGAQDYDLYLRVVEKTDKIFHIPKVLYHWRKVAGSTSMEFGEKSYANEAGRKALAEHIKRVGKKGAVFVGKRVGTYRVRYEIEKYPLVSIIVPFKDKPELLQMCLDSILNKSTYSNFEIIGVSNNSSQKETFDMMRYFEQRDNRISFYEYNVPFNYSKINNYAVFNYAKGEHIVLLNNDIEILTPQWIEAMLEFSQRVDVGCVGAKLYYPDNTLQHAGVIVGLGGVAGHSHKHFAKESPGYFNRLDIVQNLSAVTAACLMVKRTVYEELCGLDEHNLKIAFNDVDFCLRVLEHGYLNVFTPYCEAYHHESVSRGYEDNAQKIERFNSEIAYMRLRHEGVLERGDKYYNKNLTLDREDFSLREEKI